MDDYLDKTYQALQYFKVDNLGTIDQFSASMKDPIYRGKIYDALTYFKVNNLGDYADWEMKFLKPAEEDSSFWKAMQIPDKTLKDVSPRESQSIAEQFDEAKELGSHIFSKGITNYIQTAPKTVAGLINNTLFTATEPLHLPKNFHVSHPTFEGVMDLFSNIPMFVPRAWGTLLDEIGIPAQSNIRKKVVEPIGTEVIKYNKAANKFIKETVEDVLPTS